MFKVVEALHVTAHQRKMIKWMLENDQMQCASKRMSARRELIEGDKWKVTFTWNESNDWGKKITRKSFATIEVKK